MTIAKVYPARGLANPDTRTGGRESIFSEVIDRVNSLEIGAIAGSDLNSALTINQSLDYTLPSLASVLIVTFSAASKTLTLPATSDGTVYDGGRYTVYNNGSNAFTIDDNDGNELVASLEQNEMITLICTDDSSDAGSWIVDYNGQNDQTMTGNLDMDDNELISPVFKDTAYTVVSATVSGSYNLDWSVAEEWQLELSGDTTLTGSNYPDTPSGGYKVVGMTQDTAGGHDITYITGTIHADNGTPPDLDTTAGAYNEIAVKTTDAGTTIVVYPTAISAS